MGYSIMTPFASEEVKLKMLQFLQQHYRSFTEVIGVDISLGCVGSPTDDLDYPSDEYDHLIGFNYNASGAERSYTFSICFWMAMMAGMQMQEGDETKPFVIYDGDEIWPLYIDQQIPANQPGVAVDAIGYRDCDRWMSLFYETDKDKEIDPLVKAELQRLTKLWKEVA